MTPGNRLWLLGKTRGKKMRGIRRYALVALLLSTCCASGAYAQDGALTSEAQLRGRQLLAQSCGICHLPPSLGAKTYGPALNKASTAGNDDLMRAFIVNGTPRMPAFKHYLQPAEIDAIIAYVRTVPAASAAANR